MNIMERVFVFMFVFVLLAGGVFAADDWDSVNIGDSVGSEDAGLQNTGDTNDYIEDDYVSAPLETSQSSGDGKFYTPEFYIALVLGVFVLGIIGVVAWFLIRGPRNKWEK